MKSRGLSLLEILLVLAVSAVITLSALRVVRLMEFKADVARLKSNVELIFILMNDYYVAPSPNQDPSTGKLYPHNCLDPAVSSASFSTLLNTATQFSLLTPSEIALINPTTTPQPFSVSTIIVFNDIGGANPKYNLVVIEDFTKSGLTPDGVQTIRGQLNGDALTASSNAMMISWTRLPNQTLTNSLDNGLWVAMSAHDAKLAQYKDPSSNPPKPTFCPI